jgi:hypothetical protein
MAPKVNFQILWVLLKIIGKLIEGVEEQILCVVRRDVLRSDLDDAWSFGFSGSKDCSEVEVMGEQEMPIRFSP